MTESDMFICFFFKQKTAYELRISDWSSDVCSSDLIITAAVIASCVAGCGDRAHLTQLVDLDDIGGHAALCGLPDHAAGKADAEHQRAEEGRVGKEGVSSCKSRWSADHYIENKCK